MSNEHPALAKLADIGPSSRGGPKRWAPPDELADAIVDAARRGGSGGTIAEALTASGVPVSDKTVRRWLKDQGIE